MDGRISKHWRWTLIGVVAALSVFGFVGTTARLVTMMSSSSAVKKVGRPGQLMVLKTHPLLPAFTVDSWTGKAGKKGVKLGLTY
jgi:hypothetical protein